MPTSLIDAWPIFGLRIVTPTVELRLPTDEELCELADVAVRGVHDDDWMPFQTPWTQAGPDEVRRGVIQYGWRSRAELTPTDWTLNFGVWADGELVGTQGILAKSYGQLRSVNTGSWIGQEFQGRGIGKEMRVAVLHFAFAGLDAVEAHTEAREDNAASIGVTRSVGYADNGESMHGFGDQASREIRFRMSRQAWQERRRADIELIGVEPCLPLLGVDVGTSAGD